MTTHELKAWPIYFQPVLDGTKTFEARRNDRNFQVGDILWLREWKPKDSIHSALGEYSGREVKVSVTYILTGSEANNAIGINEGFCVMAVKPIRKNAK
jgi:hypothetical protein